MESRKFEYVYFSFFVSIQKHNIIVLLLYGLLVLDMKFQSRNAAGPKYVFQVIIFSILCIFTDFRWFLFLFLGIYCNRCLPYQYLKYNKCKV